MRREGEKAANSDLDEAAFSAPAPKTGKLESTHKPRATSATCAGLFAGVAAPCLAIRADPGWPPT